MDNELKALIKPRQEILEKLILCLTDNLNIAFPMELIHADVPLFGAGLGLDSIDALEVVMTVENEFGVSIDESNIASMRTLNTLADSIQQSLAS